MFVQSAVDRPRNTLFDYQRQEGSACGPINFLESEDMSECLYIVYHNISLSNSEVAIDLKGVEESFFKEQLEALCRNYEPISLEMMSESVKSGIALPSKCFCMTFDDGYKEHISIAADYLSRNNVTGSFYINTQKLEAKKLITVDKQRFLQ